MEPSCSGHTTDGARLSNTGHRTLGCTRCGEYSNAKLQQGIYRHRKSGRYDNSETPHATPHLRWPTKVCVIGTVHKRATFDELSLGQFVIGFVANALDAHHVET